MKNAMQLKAVIRNIAKEKGIAAQALLQNYMMERLLERISVSSYSDNFILKGGMLIAAMVGHDSRTTMDMDATLRGMPLSEESVSNAFMQISSIDLNDGISFQLKDIDLIREDDIYGGYRVSFTALFDTLKTALKVDLTTGDKITPKEINYSFSLMFEERSINILAYNVETVLAEKYETILRRSIFNTRIRDFYDVYALLHFQTQNISIAFLNRAIIETAKARNSLSSLLNPEVSIQQLTENSSMQAAWRLYQRDYSYAKEISWEEIMDAVRSVSQLLSLDI